MHTWCKFGVIILIFDEMPGGLNFQLWRVGVGKVDALKKIFSHTLVENLSGYMSLL